MIEALPIITSKEAAQRAREQIQEGMKADEMQGLLTRWSKFNHSAMGSFRFGKTYIIGGLSGSAKSFLVNMMRKDFLDKTINPLFKKKFRLLHISFEMSAADEVIREVSGKIGMSYADILSAYKHETGETLKQEAYEEIDAYLKLVEEVPVDYIEVTGTVRQIEKTIDDYQLRYPEEYLVITLDHTLLTDYEGEKDEVALVVKLSKMALQVKKRINCMWIIIAQLNGEIEEADRITKPARHYPIPRDLYGSKAIRRDADFIFVIHAPFKLGIPRYGTTQFKDGKMGYPTESQKKKIVFFLHNLKARTDETSLMAFSDDLKNGNLIQMDM